MQTLASLLENLERHGINTSGILESVSRPPEFDLDAVLLEHIEEEKAKKIKLSSDNLGDAIKLVQQIAVGSVNPAEAMSKAQEVHSHLLVVKADRSELWRR